MKTVNPTFSRPNQHVVSQIMSPALLWKMPGDLTVVPTESGISKECDVTSRWCSRSFPSLPCRKWLLWMVESMTLYPPEVPHLLKSHHSKPPIPPPAMGILNIDLANLFTANLFPFHDSLSAFQPFTSLPFSCVLSSTVFITIYIVYTPHIYTIFTKATYIIFLSSFLSAQQLFYPDNNNRVLECYSCLATATKGIHYLMIEALIL